MADAQLTTFEASTRRPADFDSFWDGARVELSRVALSLSFEYSTLRSTPDVSAYEVTYRGLGGLRISGWLCVPTAAARDLPAVAIYPGYSGAPAIPRAWARAGYVALQISPRGHHGSDDVFAPGFPGLMTSGIDDPRAYAYRGLYCDAWRAIDVLLQRPEVDHGRVYATGGSQGGALALVTGAARSEVKAVAADVPFLTGIRDALALGNSFPYEEVKDVMRLQPTMADRFRDTLDYFDTLNFAAQIHVPTLLSVGLKDDICPPQTAFALFNRLTCPKELREYDDAGHEGGGYRHMQVKLAWLAGQS